MKWILGIALCASSSGWAATQPNATLGKAIYTQNCMGCHGDKGQGGVGPKLAGGASKWKVEVFTKAMLEGKNPKGMAFKAPMPNFSKIGFGGSGKAPSSADLANLFAHIRTFK
ncbi:MAG: cytochrome c [Deinococcaceae bacterium]